MDIGGFPNLFKSTDHKFSFSIFVAFFPKLYSYQVQSQQHTTLVCAAARLAGDAIKHKLRAPVRRVTMVGGSTVVMLPA